MINCDSCKKEITDNNYIIEKDLGYLCPECQKILDNTGSLEPVDDINKSKRKFRCSICHWPFSMSNLILIPETKDFVCTRCIADEVQHYPELKKYTQHAYLNTKPSSVIEVLDENPFEGKKAIIIVTENNRGSAEIRDPRVKLLSPEIYLDALCSNGQNAAIYGGIFTCNELRKFVNDWHNKVQRIKNSEDDEYYGTLGDYNFQLSIYDAFELDSWNDEDESDRSFSRYELMEYYGDPVRLFTQQTRSSLK